MAAIAYLARSKEITGYRVSVIHREAFPVVGYTIVSPPGKRGEARVQKLWSELIADGRLARLRAASASPAPVLGLGSWDPEVPKGGARYTIGIEETPQTDFTPLETEGSLFRKPIGASDWLCFETKLGEEYPGRFWKDNPYKMMGPLGYRFRGGAEGDTSLGLHIEVYPPAFGFGSGPNKDMEFWITVEKA